MRIPLLVSCIVLWLGGCAPAGSNRERLVAEVLKTDPGFAAVLDKHREVANRIETYERELALKRSAVERAIAEMRRELAAAVAAVKSKTVEAKQRLEPERSRLTLALSMASEALRAQQAQRASLGRSIARLNKAVQTARAAWTADERARQERQIREMLRDAGRVDQEIATLKAHLRLLKLKLQLIQL